VGLRETDSAENSTVCFWIISGYRLLKKPDWERNKMEMRSGKMKWCLVGALVLAMPVYGASEFYIEETELALEDTNHSLTVACNNDFVVYGFSIALAFENDKIQITQLALGSDASAAEWDSIEFSNLNDPASLDAINASGELMVGVVMDWVPDGVDPDITIPAGDGHNLVEISISLLATEPGETQIIFKDLKNPENNADVKNVLTTSVGNTVSPTQDLQTVQIVSRKPVITGLQDNEGEPGEVFKILGTMFDEAGLEVTVCGTTAAINSSTATEIEAVIPDCPLGWAEVQVCTDQGCDSEPLGVNVIQRAPVILELNGNQGEPGKEFQVLGSDFDKPGLEVTLCGKTATIVDSDAQNITLVAPDCGTVGWSLIEVSTIAGSDSEAQGFLYSWEEPVITGLEDNEGEAGQVFKVMGQNFDRPDLAVTVCGTAATVNSSTAVEIEVVAPEGCARGWAQVEVCTRGGCDSEGNGFLYPLPPVITEITDNYGEAGKEFQVIGENFDRPGLEVTVCGEIATVNSATATTLEVVAPEGCAMGWAALEICSGSLCDSDPRGFDYQKKFIRGNSQEDDSEVNLVDVISTLFDQFGGTPSNATCRDALDADDSGEIDLADIIYTLEYLFKGGDVIPPPYPDEGYDPTPDDLPPCQ